ncbi:MAG TPA: tetratricopeptide repeat protein, partial [Ktedonobacteraceae bacterium]|nr:tetratricopeptide repeat protein [Ktedonobacteraceae bacterium]
RVLAPQAIEHEAGEALALVKAVGGLPLALTLIGNHLRSHSYSNQPRRVGAALTRLSNASARLHISEQRGPNERHSSLPRGTPISLASVISVTDAQLNAQQRAALHALAVFPPKPDSFSEEAALAVTDGSPDILDALVDAGLLETGEADHYMMHQTIADYARARLEDTGNTAPYERLVRYIATFVSGNKKDYTRLERVSSTIYIALEEAYTSGLSDALMRIIYNFMPYLLSRGLYSLAEKHLRRALELAEQAGDDYDKTGALLYLGEIAQKQGNYEQASQQLEDGLALARQVGKPDRIIALLSILGRVTWKRGEYAKAEVSLQEGLNLARAIDDKEHLCDILETLGSVAASLGNYHQSMLYMEEALPIAKALEDSEKTCTLLINLGVTEGEQGNHQKASEYFLEGLELAKKIGHREWISLLLSNLGEAESEMGYFTQAEAHFLEGLEVAKQIDHREWISGLLSNLGQIAHKQGHYDKAKDHLEKSLAIAEQINRPQLLSEVLYVYGDLYLDWQLADYAESTFKKMLTNIPEGSQDLLALSQYGLARALAAQGKFEKAREFGESSLTIFEILNHRTAGEVRQWLKVLSN